MFGLFKKDPVKQLKKEYVALTEQAMQAQRRGDIEGYSELATKADKLYQELQSLERQQQA